MACEVEIQLAAQAEFESTVEYLFALGKQMAVSFLDEWEKQLDVLRDGRIEYPLSRFEVLAKLGYRYYLVKNYVVLYYRDDDRAVIAHLFHQSQDYARIVMDGE